MDFLGKIYACFYPKSSCNCEILVLYCIRIKWRRVRREGVQQPPKKFMKRNETQ